MNVDSKIIFQSFFGSKNFYSWEQPMYITPKKLEFTFRYLQKLIL